MSAPRLAATFLAAAGDARHRQQLTQGTRSSGTTYHVHIDGYDLLPYLTGEEDQSPRRGFFYFSDDCDVLALRYENWKIVFLEQRCQGTLQIWFEPFTELRVPKIFNLRTDPFERADVTSNTYWDWVLENVFIALYGNALVLRVPRHVQGVPAPQRAGVVHHHRRGGEAQEALRIPRRLSLAGLDSWRDGPTKSAIVDFVDRVSTAGADFVEPEARIAVFDNDGTLWVEKPAYVQLDFLVRRLAAQAAADPSLADRAAVRRGRVRGPRVVRRRGHQALRR